MLYKFTKVIIDTDKINHIYLSHRIIDSFPRPLAADKTGINFMIFILIFVENCL